ncbi:MAG: hypothetical protein SV253_07325 [Halobacteria archaeon]|nr:hypothetical protein [Halobacteria archaeon]
MTRSDTDERSFLVKAGAGVAVALVLYMAVVQQIFLGAVMGAIIVFLYLVWRFVRAHERIAEALED